MKYLIKADLTANMKGEFVEANESADEFIFDTEVASNGATIEGIAEANGITLNSRAKVAEKQVQLSEGLATLQLSEVANMTESQTVKNIVESGVEAGKSDNDMLVEIVNEGVSFKAAIKLFKVAMEEGGFRITTKLRAEKINGLLDEAEFAPESYDDVLEAIEGIVKTVSDTTNAQASAGIRKYAKDNEIELPKAPKKTKGGATGGIAAKIRDFMVANPTSTEEEFKKFVDDNEWRDVYFQRYWPVFAIAQAMAETLNS